MNAPQRRSHVDRPTARMFDQRPRHARALDAWCQAAAAAGPLFLAGMVLAALLVSR